MSHTMVADESINLSDSEFKSPTTAKALSPRFCIAMDAEASPCPSVSLSPHPKPLVIEKQCGAVQEWRLQLDQQGLDCTGFANGSAQSCSFFPSYFSCLMLVWRLSMLP